MLLKVTVRDEADKLVPCRLTLRRLGGEGQQAETACCEGTHLFAVPRGDYELTATRGRMYRPAACTVKGAADHAEAGLTLRRVFDPKALGLYSFDAHTHVSRDADCARGTIEAAALEMKCEEFNFFFAGSPYDPEDHYEHLSERIADTRPYRQRYADAIGRARSADFILDIGNEAVKCRYGHVFLINHGQRPPFSRHYDASHDGWQCAGEGPEPGYDILYPYEAIGEERGANTLAVAAHPTSWWTQGERFITNISASIGFDALAGALDAVVVLGYDRDHPWYQRLWYELLDNGYFMPGVAETDAAFDRPDDPKLRFKTYAWSGEFSVDALCRAVRAGRCVASSGPVLELRVDGNLPGSVLPHEPGQTFDVSAECFACCEAPLKTVQLIVNGSVEDEWPADGERAAARRSLAVQRDSYVLAKCYDAAGNTAICSPVYIRNAPFVNAGYRSGVRASVTAGGVPANGWYQLDNGSETAFSGGFELAMPPAAALRIRSGGHCKTVRLFELPELQAVFRNLYLGSFNQDGKYTAGQVPADAFRVGCIRGILDHVDLAVDLLEP